MALAVADSGDLQKEVPGLSKREQQRLLRALQPLVEELRGVVDREPNAHAADGRTPKTEKRLHGIDAQSEAATSVVSDAGRGESSSARSAELGDVLDEHPDQKTNVANALDESGRVRFGELDDLLNEQQPQAAAFANKQDPKFGAGVAPVSLPSSPILKPARSDSECSSDGVDEIPVNTELPMTWVQHGGRKTSVTMTVGENCIILRQTGAPPSIEIASIYSCLYWLYNIIWVRLGALSRIIHIPRSTSTDRQVVL
eukprot:SAG31_NODE_4509_length_3178_cov_13.049367_3_plen_256_part_00